MAPASPSSKELRRFVRALIDANMTGEQDEAANAELAAPAADHPVPISVDPDGRSRSTSTRRSRSTR